MLYGWGSEHIMSYQAFYEFDEQFHKWYIEIKVSHSVPSFPGLISSDYKWLEDEN